MREIVEEIEGRVAPVRPRPPIVGTPPPAVADRPKCPGCGRPLRPWLNNICEETPDGMRDWMHPTGREWTGRYHGYLGVFCGTQCAAEYAVRVTKILIPALADSVRANVQAKLVRPKDY
jgi:hypothetical protein